VHPIERRHPRVTVQDLRRDLREADEDRYRLLVRTGDWRNPTIGVAEIRRQLREADEDRFHLTMRVRTLVRLIKRAGIGACVLLAGSAAVALWARTPAPQPAVTSNAKAEPPLSASQAQATETPAEAIPIAARSASSPQTAADEQGPMEPVVVPAAAKDEAPADRRTLRQGQTARTLPANRVRVAPLRKAPPPRRPAPRPLHPGEFGRNL
jgi:hypothetical protein